MTNNNLVYEMIEANETDEKMKRAMLDIFKSEIQHSSASNPKYKIQHCKEIIEKAIK